MKGLAGLRASLPRAGRERGGSREGALADAAVRFDEVWKGFGGPAVLRGVDLEVPRGSTLTVMGGSGSGKTVLLRLAAGLLKPDRGRISLLGTEIVLNAVRPESQGHGLYPALVIAALHRSVELEAVRCIVSTQVGNVAAQKVWVRTGFEPSHAVHTFHLWLV